jgi:hypothetical protein
MNEDPESLWLSIAIDSKRVVMPLRQSNKISWGLFREFLFTESLMFYGR